LICDSVTHASCHIRFLSTIRVSPVAGFFRSFGTFFFPDQPVQGGDAPAEDALLPPHLLIQEGKQAQTQLAQPRLSRL
jgi:hypothetical protein